MSMYFGDVSLCYTNSLAMALDSVGVDVRPEYLEALMVMGNGASIMKDDPRHPLVFFDNGEPDVSISNCLRMLGFAWEDFFVEGPTTDLTEVRDRLARMLESGPVVAGPLDMGLLTYNPNFHGLGGVDHFVCVLGLDGGRLHLHDPAGFPLHEHGLRGLREGMGGAGNLLQARVVLHVGRLHAGEGARG